MEQNSDDQIHEKLQSEIRVALTALGQQQEECLSSHSRGSSGCSTMRNPPASVLGGSESIGWTRLTVVHSETQETGQCLHTSTY